MRVGSSVSVVICIRNVEEYIGNCIDSILNQTFNDFEIVLIDDLSSDNTPKIIEKFNDTRIRYFRNDKWLGIAQSRNRGLKFATGKYIFLTDGDCTVSKNWIEEGLKSFNRLDCVGVEGRIYYVSSDYKPRFSDSFRENRYGGQFMTGNVAYRRSVIEKVGGFDEEINFYADREYALRIMRLGRIYFNPNMVAYHPRVVFAPKTFLKAAAVVSGRVLLFKRYREKEYMQLWRIVYPFNLAKIIFPPLILANLFFKDFRSKEDFNLLPYTYLYVILERLYLWKTCAKERVFLI